MKLSLNFRQYLVVIVGVTGSIAAVLVGWWIRGAVPGNSIAWMPDFDVYWNGAHALLNGMPLYDFKIPPTGLPFTYPPFAALFFIPLAVIRLGLAQVVWVLINLAALYSVLWISLAKFSQKFTGHTWLLPALTFAPCLLIDAVFANAVFGEVNMLLMAFIMIDSATNRKTSGVLLGLAAGIKLTPLLFIVWALVRGQYRRAFLASVVFVGTLLIPTLIDRKDVISYWIHGKAFELSRMLTPTDSMHSILGIVARTTGRPTNPPSWWIIISVAVAIGGLLVARRCAQKDELGSIILVGTIMVLVAPITWLASLVWTVPATCWLICGCISRPSTTRLLSSFGLYCWFICPTFWLAQRTDQDPPYQTSLIGNLLATFGSATAGLIVVAAIIITADWRRKPQAQPI